MTNRTHGWRHSVALSILLSHLGMLLAPGFSPCPAWGQPGPSADPVATARDHYNFARFEEAIDLLEPLVDAQQLQGEKLIEAKEILARSHVKLGNSTEAKSWFQSLLRQDPTWRPNPIWVPADERAVFEEARSEISEELAPPTIEEPPAAPREVVIPPATIQEETEPAAEKPLTSKWWFWAGVGTVAAALAVLAGGGGGGGADGPGDLPTPPPPPSP